jgi:hypothetical protein
MEVYALHVDIEEQFARLALLGHQLERVDMKQADLQALPLALAITGLAWMRSLGESYERATEEERKKLSPFQRNLAEVCANAIQKERNRDADRDDATGLGPSGTVRREGDAARGGRRGIPR